MIAYLKGEFAIKTPSLVVVDVNGVGYELQISLHTFGSISNAKEGKLLTYLHITENSQTLFGFFDKIEKELFLHLLSVSGVGASTARMMLSGLRPEEIKKAIVDGNTKQLESVKGIGKKTAERIIVELKDKLSKTDWGLNLDTLTGGTLLPHQDALEAMIALGINRNLADAALRKVSQSNDENLTIENTIKLALKNL